MSAPFVGARVAARPGTSGRDLTSPTRTQRNVGRTVRPARPAPIVASSHRAGANEAVDVMEWDVVVFRDGDGLSVGKVESVRVDDGTCVCQPLFQEEDSGVWLEATYTRGAKTVQLRDTRRGLCAADGAGQGVQPARGTRGGLLGDTGGPAGRRASGRIGISE